MGRSNKRSLVDQLIELEEMGKLEKFLIREKKEEHKDDKKKSKVATWQWVLLAVIAYPFTGPLVVGLWKMSNIIVEQLLK